MSKVKLKTHDDSVQTSGPLKMTNKKQQRHSGKKKTLFFPKTETSEEEAKPAKTNIKPPTDPQEFSSNWRNLLQIIASNPENSKQPKDADVRAKQPQKTASLSKDSQTLIKHFNKPSTVDKPAAKTREKDGDQKNGKDTTGRKPYKTERRKRKDENKDKEKPKEKQIEMKTAEPNICFDDVDPDDVKAAVGSEAADVAQKHNGKLKSDTESTDKALVKEHGFEGLTRAVAMDCEMVGIGPDGEESILARVSLVNLFGKCVYDKYVKPTEKVTDYRTAVSGIRPEDIEHGEDIRTVQKEVAEILNGRILVGHAIHNDLKILLLGHPKKMIRDTQKYKPFKQRVKSGRPALRVLCKEILNVQVQSGEHSSVQDAQAAMRLYTLVKKQWEAELKASRSLSKNPKSPQKPKAPKRQTS